MTNFCIYFKVQFKAGKDSNGIERRRKVKIVLVEGYTKGKRIWQYLGIAALDHTVLSAKLEKM